MDTETKEKPKSRALTETDLQSGQFSEKVNIDAGADAFAHIPPVPDNKYIALLGPSSNESESPTIEGTDWPANGDKPAMTVIKVNTTITLQSTLSGDKTCLEGKSIRFDKTFKVNASKRNGKMVSEAATILNYLGIPVPSGTGMDVIALTLAQALKAPTSLIGVRTLWRAGFVEGKMKANGYSDRGTFKKSGMRTFPLMKGGNLVEGPFNPVAEENGEELRAKAYIMEVFSLTAQQ